MNMNNVAKEVARMLLEIKAIKLNPDQPFTWASGWKSPIYCDNRLSLSYPVIRKFIKNKIVNTIEENFSAVEAIVGVATAGIPQGALVADQLDKPFLYVRSKTKGHGMENMLEGKVTPKQKVVVIEDLVSTGGSSLKAVNALKTHDIEVLGMVSIFTYGFSVAEENFKNADVKLISLSSYNELIETAMKLNFISSDDIERLRTWREDPENWGQVQ
jgi:orotate phosphoribosyltransferase